MILSIDIGASSGRHIISQFVDGKWELTEVYRFPNNQKWSNGQLCWDIEELFSNIIAGMKACAEQGLIPDSVGIDTWGVDFILLDENFQRLHELVCYRDSRTDGMDYEVERILSFEELYNRTGIQKQLFNTIYKLKAVQLQEAELLKKAKYFLFTPDYLHYLLSGKLTNEYTIATTSALVNLETKDWDWELLEKLELPREIFQTITEPGSSLGNLTEEIAREVGFTCQVILPASHDTGSAFLAVPSQADDHVFLSSGTWSLLGLEKNDYIISSAACHSNFTNEGGYQDTIRFLKNIMGLWMIQSIRNELGQKHTFPELAELAKSSTYDGIVDVNDQRFLAPESMYDTVVEVCQESDFSAPESLADVMRCIYNSLAMSYCDAIYDLETITGESYNSINIVGGGSQDNYLNQLTANYSQRKVWAGPVEGTVIGNAMVQAIRLGIFKDLADARAYLHKSFDIRSFEPQEV